MPFFELYRSTETVYGELRGRNGEESCQETELHLHDVPVNYWMTPLYGIACSVFLEFLDYELRSLGEPSVNCSRKCHVSTTSLAESQTSVELIDLKQPIIRHA